MNTQTIMLAVIFSFFSFSAFSQVSVGNKEAHPGSGTPVPTKGYYAIGTNAEKLNSAPALPIRITADDSYPVVQKGYYAIGNNNRKLGKQLIIEGASLYNKAGKGVAVPAVDVIRKGYYSIDRNSEKLK